MSAPVGGWIMRDSVKHPGKVLVMLLDAGPESHCIAMVEDEVEAMDILAFNLGFFEDDVDERALAAYYEATEGGREESW